MASNYQNCTQNDDSKHPLSLSSLVPPSTLESGPENYPILRNNLQLGLPTSESDMTSNPRQFLPSNTNQAPAVPPPPSQPPSPTKLIPIHENKIDKQMFLPVYTDPETTLPTFAPPRLPLETIQIQKNFQLNQSFSAPPTISTSSSFNNTLSLSSPTSSSSTPQSLNSSSSFRINPASSCMSNSGYFDLIPSPVSLSHPQNQQNNHNHHLINSFIAPSNSGLTCQSESNLSAQYLNPLSPSISAEIPQPLHLKQCQNMLNDQLPTSVNIQPDDNPQTLISELDQTFQDLKSAIFNSYQKTPQVQNTKLHLVSLINKAIEFGAQSTEPREPASILPTTMDSGSAPLSTPLLPINNPSACNFRSSYSNPQYYSQNSSPPANNSQNPTQDGQSFQTLHGEHQRIEKKRSRETIEDEELYPNMKFSRSSESSNLFLEMSNIKGSLSSAAQTVDQDLSSLNIPTSDNFGYPLSELCPTNKCKVPPMHSSDGTLYPATACSADTLASAYPDFTSSLVTSDLALPLKSQDRPTQFKLSIPASPTEPELSEVIHKNSINSGDLLGRLTPKHKTSSKVALSFKNSREQPVLSLESTINNHRSHNIPSPVKQQKDRPESREELKTKGALFSKHEYLHQSSYSDQNELIHSLSQAAIEAELSRSGSKQVKNIKESSDHSSITTDVVGMADANSSCLAQNQAELQGVGSGFIGNSFGFNCNPTECVKDSFLSSLNSSSTINQNIIDEYNEQKDKTQPELDQFMLKGKSEEFNESDNMQEIYLRGRQVGVEFEGKGGVQENHEPGPSNSVETTGKSSSATTSFSSFWNSVIPHRIPSPPINKQMGAASAGVSAELAAQFEPIFTNWLGRLCSDLNMTDSKGEIIHQTLMARKMQRLEESIDFRPFKFRIQAFTNSFYEELVKCGFNEEELSMKKVRQYLWSQSCISRFNEEGKKAKSKGNHVWHIEAQKINNHQWNFLHFKQKIIGDPPPEAYENTKWSWSAKVWDPQCSVQNIKVVFSSKNLPKWLSWRGNVLSGIPGKEDVDKVYNIVAIATTSHNFRKYHLELPFQITIKAKKKAVWV